MINSSSDKDLNIINPSLIPKSTPPVQPQVSNYWLRTKTKLRNYYDFIAKDPKWLVVFILGRFLFIRSIVNSWGSQSRIPEYNFSESTIHNVVDNTDHITKNVDDISHSLAKNGLYLNINLPIQVIDGILSYAETGIVYGNGKSEHKFDFSQLSSFQRDKPFTIAEYVDPAKCCSTIEALQKDPYLLEIASRYFNARAVCIGSRLWWSFASSDNHFDRLKFGQELFHYDLPRFRFLRFFFYLTDVNSLSGPHVCIQGSHKKKDLFHQLTLFIGRSDQAMINYYGAENIIEILGKSGFGFAEDLYCFHKGKAPIDEDRLMLAVDFGVR